MKGSDYKNNEKDLNFSEITEKLNKIGEKFENLNPMGFKFSTELIDAFVKGYEKTVNDFKTKKEGFEIQYENYIKKEGIVLPNDFSDFIFWFEELYPEQSFKDIQFSLSNPNVFKQFHEYKIRMFENSKWSILKEIEFLESQKIEAVPTPQQETKTSANNLAEIITHQNSVKIVESIKIQYKNIQGKRLKLLLIAMQELNLIPKERIAKKFHNYCKNEFNWNIASYTAMNDYAFNDVTDKDEVAEIKSFLSNIINTN